MTDAIFDKFKLRDVAKAVAASNRILIEMLVAIGADPDTIKRAYKKKSQEMITQQFDDGAGQLLMLLGGVVQR
jgi:hypothetical protein